MPTDRERLGTARHVMCETTSVSPLLTSRLPHPRPLPRTNESSGRRLIVNAIAHPLDSRISRAKVHACVRSYVRQSAHMRGSDKCTRRHARMRVKGTPISDPPLRLAPQDESGNKISKRNTKRERERERRRRSSFQLPKLRQ